MREMEARTDFSAAGSFPKVSQQLGLGQAEAGSWELHSGLPCDLQEPSRKLGPEQSSPSSTDFPVGILNSTCSCYIILSQSFQSALKCDNYHFKCENTKA